MLLSACAVAATGSALLELRNVPTPNDGASPTRFADALTLGESFAFDLVDAPLEDPTPLLDPRVIQPMHQTFEFSRPHSLGYLLEHRL